MKPERLVVFPDADADLLTQVRDARDALGGIAELDVHVGRPASIEDYRSRIQGAEALLLGWDLPIAALDAAPKLEAISFLGTGVSNFVDLAACARAGITVMNVSGYGDDAVAQHTLALIVSSLRRIVGYDRLVRSGGWGVTGLDREFAATTLGVLGLGGIGARVAELAAKLGFCVVGWTRSGRPGETRAGARLDELDAVLAGSDVVSLHLPLTPETTGLLSEARLGKMKPGSILVNTARAELVDERALIAALERGRPALAALDVLWDEPAPADHPLLTSDNVILTPHVAFATQEASERMVRIAIENLAGYFTGEPRNVVCAPAEAGRQAVEP